MSKWRQRGFVQDSDEEEDVHIESQDYSKSLNGPVQERVEDANDQCGGNGPKEQKGKLPRRGSFDQDGGPELMDLDEEDGNRTTGVNSITRDQSTPSPITTTQRSHREALSDSPDLLHNSSNTGITDHRSTFVSSQILGEPDFGRTSLAPKAQDFRKQISLSQDLNVSSQPKRWLFPEDKAARKLTDASQILGEFGVSALSDASESNDSLSDPPTDIESPTGYTSPSRRTKVQVVIPSSTALQRQIIEQGPVREFRHRKPIQLHPYLLEGERYRREFQSRGIKPMPRERSPPRRQGHVEAESQEQEFHPNEPIMSSPHSPEIPVSTPITQGRRKDAVSGNLAHFSSSHARVHKLPATQIQTKRGAKRRKLNDISSTQDPDTRHDIWSLPPESPPDSSSPPAPRLNSALRRPARRSVMTPVPNLPTPSTSSVIQEDILPVLDSDSEPVGRSALRSGVEPRRLTITIPSNSSSSSDSSPDESDTNDNELRQVGRKIRGVLPASWLRLDQKAQERRKAQTRHHERQRQRIDAAISPEIIEPQRGVAQKVIKSAGSSRKASGSKNLSEDAIVISDESDVQSDPVYRHVDSIQDVAEDPFTIAAALDRRYADDDLENMENDRLQLFTLAGTNRKRKKQTKLTDAFANPRQSRPSGSSLKNSALTRASTKFHGAQNRPRKSRRTSPPALSVMDFDLSPSEGSHSAPQFLRLARRQARQRPDLARQRLSDKQIRLHTARDTEDANVTLQQWRKGVLKPKYNISQLPTETREPLTDRADNQQGSQPSLARTNFAVESNSIARVEHGTPKQRKRKTLPPGLLVFQRTAAQKTIKPAQSSKNTKKQPQVIHRPPLPFRTAQLEHDEVSFSKGHRNFAFERGLRRVDQHFSQHLPLEQTLRNPQLARFLADDDTPLPPLASVADTGEKEEDRLTSKPQLPKRRLVRKPKAQRLDIDTREYRQPSEPAVQAIFIDNKADQAPAIEQRSLQGLDSQAARFPTTFDVSPLKFGTYFQSTTFIGAEELYKALQMAKLDSRDLDEPAGYCTISHDGQSVRCGPWGDETCSRIQELLAAIWLPVDEMTGQNQVQYIQQNTLPSSSKFLRAMITYFSSHLSFLDSIDRQDFSLKLAQLIRSLFERFSKTHMAILELCPDPQVLHAGFRSLTYLLVLAAQVRQIARHKPTESSIETDITGMMKDIAKLVITSLLRRGIPELGNFLEKNKIYIERENGIHDSDILVECVVICMHTLQSANIHGLAFWDVVSQDLSSQAQRAIHLKTFESIWATVFTLLPFGELDECGIYVPSRKASFMSANWTCIRAILRRLFELYPSTNRNIAAFNDYIRANLTRCYVLIDNWHWKRCDQVLSTTFDFFAKNSLKQLRREESSGSIQFLEDLVGQPSLTVGANDNAFHIFLKCLALGLHGMKDTFPEKKIRSFVNRFVPNHGRSYPKDQPLDEESLVALRNHHDLLCTLYWASPPSCRPKLDSIRCLVHHENSHREACRVSIRAWANLTAFQLSTNELYPSAQPLALWLKDIIEQTLKQYRLAKTEAEEFLKNGNVDRTSAISSNMVRQTMEKNQEQVIAALRDCINGMRKAILCGTDQAVSRIFLLDSDIVQLLELPHFEDHRLVHVIRDALALLRDYVSIQKRLLKQETSQQSSEESQDYGDFPDFDDLDGLDDIDQSNSSPASKQSKLDFIQTPLWHLLSNAFGAERIPDDNLLMECVDTWALVAGCQVSSKQRSWSYYIGSFTQVAWQQLRHTVQTKKFCPYFMAAIIECDSSAYEEHRQEFLTTLLTCLADRESVLRFQDRLLRAIIQFDSSHPLMKNLPFFYDQQSGRWDITPDNLRTRRLGLISSLLANMRDDMHNPSNDGRSTATETKSAYAAMLKSFMTAMKSNYQELRQGSTVTGAYVEFVQKIVQFLKQYTSDICPVLPFFTDSVAFPLPAADPTYVVGRLCGYAPKLSNSGVTKQLAVFMQTVAQQAAADNQQSYLVNQLQTSLCTDETPSADRMALRSVLLQGIFPAYIEEAFSSIVGFIISKPILQSLGSILDTVILDLRVTDPDNIASMASLLVCISHAFIRGTEHLKTTPKLFRQPHILAALSYMLEAMVQIIPPLDYMCSRSLPFMQSIKPALVAYMEEFSVVIAEIVHDMVPHVIPWYLGNASPSQTLHVDLLDFCVKGLRTGINTNWSENSEGVWFGLGAAKREVFVDLGTADEEKGRLLATIEAFHGVLACVYESRHNIGDLGRSSATVGIIV